MKLQHTHTKRIIILIIIVIFVICTHTHKIWFEFKMTMRYFAYWVCILSFILSGIILRYDDTIVISSLLICSLCFLSHNNNIRYKDIKRTCSRSVCLSVRVLIMSEQKIIFEIRSCFCQRTKCVCADSNLAYLLFQTLEIWHNILIMVCQK